MRSRLHKNKRGEPCVMIMIMNGYLWRYAFCGRHAKRPLSEDKPGFLRNGNGREETPAGSTIRECNIRYVIAGRRANLQTGKLAAGESTAFMTFRYSRKNSERRLPLPRLPDSPTLRFSDSPHPSLSFFLRRRFDDFFPVDRVDRRDQ
jgi:hypothetical protein